MASTWDGLVVMSDALWRRVAAELRRAGHHPGESKPVREDDLNRICVALIEIYRSTSDELFFTLLCEVSQPYVVALAVRLRKKHRLLRSDDIVNDTLCSIFRHIDRFQPRGKSAFFRWLNVIARNHAKMAARSHSRRKKHESSAAVLDHDREADPALALQAREERALTDRQVKATATRIHEVVARLPELSQRIWHLRTNDGLEYHDIAVRLGITSGMVAMRLKRARDRIRAELGEPKAEVRSKPKQEGGAEASS